MTAPAAWMFDAPAWMRHGACAGVDPELFFPERSLPTVTATDPVTGRVVAAHNPGVREAKAVCATCPVRDACLDWALDTYEDHGIWGGTTPKERRPLRRARRAQQMETRAA